MQSTSAMVASLSFMAGVEPVDAPVYFSLKEKVDGAAEIRKVYPGYDLVFGLFSKSGFTQRMMDIAKENTGIFLINENHLV